MSTWLTAAVRFRYALSNAAGAIVRKKIIFGRMLTVFSYLVVALSLFLIAAWTDSVVFCCRNLQYVYCFVAFCIYLHYVCMCAFRTLNSAD